MRRRIPILIIGLYLSMTAAAHAADFTPSITNLSDDIVDEVNFDGSFTQDETSRIRINTVVGIEKYSQKSLRYSTSLEAVDVVEAYTTTKDGRRHDVGPHMILEQQSAESAAAPMFGDGKVKVIVFPNVEVGATLTLHFRRIQKKALFPGQFSTTEFFSDDVPRESMSLTVRAPTAMKLHVDAVDLDGGQIATEDHGQQVWRWTLSHRSAHPPEFGSVSVYDHSPRVALTTFPDFAAVGAAYLARARPKAAITPAVRKLADELTQGITDPRQQATVLYNWVSASIRYVAIYFGFDGVVPRDSDTILNTGYGDCKDHVTLLEALLAAKGIVSAPVLVNTSNSYWLPNAAEPIGVFDHAITYLPAFKLFVDSTAEMAPFGVLPASELGKPALVTDAGSDPARVVTLPIASPENASVAVVTHVKLDDEGNASGASQVDSRGVFDVTTRTIFSTFASGTASQVASRVLTLTGQDGTGTYLYGTVRDLTRPFVYRTKFELPAYAQFPGPGAIPVPIGLGSFSGISAAFEAAGLAKRDFATPFVGRQVTEKTVIELPAGIHVPRLPRPVDVTSPLGHYTSSYRIDGDAVTVIRKLEIALPSAVIEPSQYPAFLQMARAVKRDLRTQLVY